MVLTKASPRPSLNCLILLFALSFMTGCGAVRRVSSPSSPSSPPTQVLSVAVIPATAQLRAGDSVQFSATVSGIAAASKRVSWSVNGVPGGNAVVGTITDRGLYQAPAVVPNANTIKIAGVVQPSVSGAAILTPRRDFSVAKQNFSRNVYAHSGWPGLRERGPGSIRGTGAADFRQVPHTACGYGHRQPVPGRKHRDPGQESRSWIG
jgi:hypothetical protein